MTELIPLIVGFTAGAAGAMGLGGGFVLVLYLAWTGTAPSDIRAANLLFFIPTALVSMIMNRRRGLIDGRVLPYAAAAGSIGAVVGLMAADAFDTDLLGKVFALLIIAVGIRELFHKRTDETPRSLKERLVDQQKKRVPN